MVMMVMRVDGDERRGREEEGKKKGRGREEEVEEGVKGRG